MQQNNEADLIGLDDDGVVNEGITNKNNEVKPPKQQTQESAPQQQQQSNTVDDINIKKM